MRISRLMASSAILLILGACSYLPGTGPKTGTFESNAVAYHEVEDQQLDYLLVQVDANVAAHLKHQPKKTFDFGLAQAPKVLPQILAVGDQVQLTIFESAVGGLFINEDSNMQAGNQINVPKQYIDDSGFIKVPFAGLIKAAGRTPNQVSESIEAKIKNRAIEPQVIVSVDNPVGNLVSVNGRVRVPGRFEIPVNGLKLLDALSLAKGSEYPAYDVEVVIHRDGYKSAMRMTDIIENPKHNIQLKPGDQISVEVFRRYFSVMGATNVPSRNAFESEKMSVQDGLAFAHGIFDERGDPSTVVLYRIESRALLEQMGVDLTDWQHGGDRLPVIYKFDMLHPSGFFLAGEIPMKHRDLIYIANNKLHEFRLLYQIFRGAVITQQVNANTVTDTIVAKGHLKHW